MNAPEHSTGRWPWRHRRRTTATVALVAGLSLWCVVAGFIAIMAITDNWL